MNKKGFTLIEILGVMTIVALLLILVVPQLMNSADAVREKTFRTKVDLIETGAANYGLDNFRTIMENALTSKPGYSVETIDGVSYRTLTIRIGDLVPDYIEKDVESGTKFVQDPRDSGRFLDDYTVTIRINPKTRKITAEFNDITE